MDAMQFLNTIETGNNNVAKIREQLFTVTDYPVKAPFEGFDDPQTKVIYTNTGGYLGTTGNQYESLQPSAFLDILVQSVEECDCGLDLSKLEYKAFKGGKIIQFRIPTGIMRINTPHGTEGTELFILMETGFGGNSRTELGLYAKRFICSNGMRIIDAEQMLRVKHTTRMNAKAMAWGKELLIAVEKASQMQGQYQRMADIEVSKEQVQKFARKLAGVPVDADLLSAHCEVSTRKKNILASIEEGIGIEFARTGNNIWGLLNGATYYTNHLASGAGEEYVNVASGAKLNAQAQSLALSMLN